MVAFVILFSACGDLLSADNLCQQFGSRSGPTFCWACSGFKLFVSLIVFPKETFENISADDSFGNPAFNFEAVFGSDLQSTKLYSFSNQG